MIKGPEGPGCQQSVAKFVSLSLTNLGIVLAIAACNAPVHQDVAGNNAVNDQHPATGKTPDPTCGQAGQAAYFETQQQSIYICRNDNQTLTYIATPKKAGNSVMLPAMAITDGDKTAYIAQDGDRRFIIGPVGFRLEENGRAIAQEKVIRNR